ncbi:MAG: hypothetical protein IPG84_15485 [Betaproteobacteria bacterium]|nr:hypothetical protein [Betaproteobacteria bacterium]
MRESVVMVRGETSETRQIVAWLVPSDPASPPPANLWRELRRTLPDYMLPGAIVWLPALPLNANGKVDRRALPAPGENARPNDGLRVPPRDMFEGVLARIWEEVLGTNDIGVLDHFFAIGGHSLLAARLVDAVERETGLRFRSRRCSSTTRSQAWRACSRKARRTAGSRSSRSIRRARVHPSCSCTATSPREASTAAPWRSRWDPSSRR